MHIFRSKRSFQRFWWAPVLCIGILFFLLFPLETVEAKGYISFSAEDLGPAIACAPGETEFNFVARDYNTEVSVPDAVITARVRDGFSGPIIAEVISVSPTPALCFDASPIAQWIFLSTAGSATHVDMVEQWGLVFDPVAAASIANRKMQVHMHVMPNGVKIASHISPIGPWLNYDPSLQLEFFSIPTLHGTTRVTNILWFDYNSTTFVGTNTGWVPVAGGGPGIYTASPLGLADGWHQWTFIAIFNGGGSTSAILGMEGWESYGIDRADPTPLSVSHSPAIPTDAEPVDIIAGGQDVLSGLDWIEIWVDGALEQTCTYAGSTAAETCGPAAVGPFAAGVHTYYAVARDRAGNEITLPDISFTVIANNPPTATTLSVATGDYCFAPSPPVTLSWTFTDPDAGDFQTAYQVQLDDDPLFGSINVDSGNVVSGSTTYTPILEYNKAYYWRVKVWDSSDAPSAWVEPAPPLPITTRTHGTPIPSFTVLPSRPAVDEVVAFTDNSTCFSVPGNVASPCKTIITFPPTTYAWDFEGDAFIDSTVRGDVTYVYSVVSTVFPSLTITDDLGGFCESSTSFTVIIPFADWREISPL